MSDERQEAERGLSEHDRLQIEMAANGSVSGQLDEWPHLAVALELAGHHLHPKSSALTVKLTCLGIVHGWHQQQLTALRAELEQARERLAAVTRERDGMREALAASVAEWRAAAKYHRDFDASVLGPSSQKVAAGIWERCANDVTAALKEGGVKALPDLVGCLVKEFEKRTEDTCGNSWFVMPVDVQRVVDKGLSRAELHSFLTQICGDYPLILEQTKGIQGRPLASLPLIVAIGRSGEGLQDGVSLQGLSPSHYRITHAPAPDWFFLPPAAPDPKGAGMLTKET